MNITLAVVGSRGDVQPFLALALSLRERGHTVTLIAPNDFETQIMAYGIDYVPIPHSLKAILEINVFEQVRHEGVNPRAIVATVRDGAAKMRNLFSDTMSVVTEAAQKADILICHGLISAFAYTLHQHLDIPTILGAALPLSPTREFPYPFFPSLPIGHRFYNPLTYKLYMRIMLPYMMEPMNAYRRRVGLTRLSMGQLLNTIFSNQIPLVLHYSPHVGPVASDWGAHIHVVGTWSLPAPTDWMPSNTLRTFLEQGNPPVFIGFGSMVVPNPAKIAQRVSDALRMVGLRGVLQAGWAGLIHEDDHLITIGEVPHDWLFPHMAAIVHHGGSGTTHTALRAGKPSLIVPFYADQPFWGRRVGELGVGVLPITPKRLTTDRLAAALHTLTQDSSIRRCAEEMGTLLRAEDGLNATYALVEQLM